ncbi:MAG: MerR family transcriptional regulator [Gammaproteobacteria bacterium]
MHERRPPPDEAFRIGAVTRLTGIPADTLRAWERRYQVVTPKRGTGHFRMYDRDDIARLTLIKRLVDSGDAIGNVAGLAMEQLKARLEESGLDRPKTARMEQSPPRVAVLGEVLSGQLAVLGELDPGIEIVALTRDRREFMEGLAEWNPDVLILEYPALYADTATEIASLLRRTKGAVAVVVYGFASRKTLDAYTDPRTLLLRSPVNFDELVRVCRREARHEQAAVKGADDGAVSLNDPLPPRRFNAAQLGELSTLESKLQCECPRHLADLIEGLCAFEIYSGQCENRSQADAALHARLHAATAKARSIMEVALEDLLKVEGIDI